MQDEAQGTYAERAYKLAQESTAISGRCYKYPQRVPDPTDLWRSSCHLGNCGLVGTM